MKAIWIEIPVEDMDRAKAFYERVFAVELAIMELGDLRMATFPNGPVALCRHPEFYFPGEEGPVVYLTAMADMAAMQERITASGGQILIPWRRISEDQGSMALFLDSEGNRVGVRG